MKEYSTVKSAVPISDHEVRVVFDTGDSGVFDCKPYFSDPYWKRLANPAFFRLVQVEFGTLVWPDDIDMAPEDVWENAIRDGDNALCVAEAQVPYHAE